MTEWTIEVGGERLEVIGPYKRNGRVHGVTAAEQKAWAESLGGRLPSAAEFDAIWLTADVRVMPKPRDVTTAPLDALHEDMLDAWRLAGEPPEPRVCCGKTWVRDGGELAANYGWHLPVGDTKHGMWRGIKTYATSIGSARVIQGVGFAHGWTHADYSQAGYCVRPAASERPTRPELPPPPSMPPPSGHARPSSPSPADTTGTDGGGVLSQPLDVRAVRRGDTGPAVLHVQRIVGAKPDGAFGPATERAVKVWQAERELVPDGVFGPKSWRAAGFVVPEPPKASDPRAPACVAALRDANLRWPTRKRISDGVMGDLAHRFKPGPDGVLGTADDVPNNSDHNLGLAVDITHDPVSGCSGDTIAELAIADERVSYVIWSRRIYNRARAAEGWRKYTGGNGHIHHVHISVRADRRDDARPWAWAPSGPLEL